jgi:transposase InsO family protein
MKGRYGGRHMTIYGHVLPGAVRLAGWAARTNLTVKAKQRLKIIDWMRAHNNNISLTARRFGYNRETIRIWKKKFDTVGMTALNDKSHRPKNFRQSKIDWKITNEIIKIRKEYPAWSKYKIAAIIRRKGMIISASTIGRILKKKGLINKKISKKRYKAAKNPKQRYPKGLRIVSAGDMVQIDTKFVTLLGGRIIYQFTAIDVLTKQRILRYYSSLMSKNGADFLRICVNEFPFQIKSVQTDNGKEFLKHFEKQCEEFGIPHYFIEARHPKQNTYVENSHGSDEREFYQQQKICQEIKLMDNRLNEWERIWNYERPHEALGYLTPKEYFERLEKVPLNAKQAIILQT